MMGGEGSGKSFHGAMYALNFLAEVEVPGHFMIIADSYMECRMEFKYLLDFIQRLGLLKSYRLPEDKDEPCSITTTTGQEFQTYSGKDPTKISGTGITPRGIVVCEVGRLQSETWGRVLGRAMRIPCWMWASGSWEVSTGWLNEFWKMGQDTNATGLKSWSIPTYSNIHLYSGRDDPKLLVGRLGYDEQRWTERVEGRPSPPEGLVYKDFQYRTHVVETLEYDKKKGPIYVAIDPGYAVYSVLFLQVDEEKGLVWIVDEIYQTGETSEGIIRKCKVKPWWDKVAGGAIDIASTQHHADRSAEEVWRAQTSLSLDYQKIAVEDGIERVMTFLQFNPKTGQPSLFVSPKCQGLLSEMGTAPSPITGKSLSYRHARNKDGTFSNQPIQQNNHSCTALAYFLVSHFGFVMRPGKLLPENYLEGKDEGWSPNIAFPRLTYME